MIHTYKRKPTSLKSYSFYERLCGDPLAECSTRIENNISKGYCSRDAKEAKCNGGPKSDLPNNSSILQSLPRESFEAQPIKFKYVRRSKSLCSNGRSPPYAERMTKMNALQPDLDNIDYISFQSKVPLVDQYQDIPGQDTGPCSGDSFSGKQFDISDKCLGPLENSASLCCDSHSDNHCINIATNEAGELNSVSPDIDRCTGRTFSGKISNKEENLSSKRSSVSDCTSTSILEKPDSEGRGGTDGSSCQNCHKRVETKRTAPLLTYNRRSRKGEYSSRTYVDILAERTNSVIRDQILFESGGSHKHNAVPKIDRGNSEIVMGHKASFSPSLEKLTDRISAIGAVISCQGNQKERNSCQLMDDVKVGKVTTLNNEVETGQQSDDAIKPPCTIYDLSIHTASEEPSTGAAMENTFKAALGISLNQERTTGTSKHFSGKPDKVDLNIAASTECEGVVLSLQSKSKELQQSVGRNIDASLSAEARRANSKELLETIKGVTATNCLPNLNAQPSNDCGFISQNRKMLYSIPLPNGSTNSKVLQLFPEGSTGHALGTSNSGFVPAATSNNCSVTMALPYSSIGPRELIQNKIFEPLSSQERQKQLLDGIGSSTGPQIRNSEGFRPNFQPFASYWSEEELDNLWVGVRRHGKDNWYIMLRDPVLRFSPWRTERDLAEKWIMEQTKLLGICPSPQPVGFPMPPFVPPRPGSMTRFLTDPTQLSVSYAYLNNQGMLPPRPPQDVNNATGNGNRLLNRRVRANRRPQNSWGRFKARNDVIAPPQFPTPRSSTSRDDISPPQPRPPLSIPPLSFQHSSNSSQFHVIHSSSSGLICPGVAMESAQPSRANPSDRKTPKELINLDSDASSEGTISDDGQRKPTLICKYDKKF